MAQPRPRPPQGRVALWLALGGLMATFIGTLGVFIGFTLLTAAFVMGIRAKRDAKAANNPEIAAGATPAIVIGAVGLFFGAIGLVGMIIFRSEIVAFDECSLGANTEVAKEACMDQLIEDLQSRFDR